MEKKELEEYLEKLENFDKLLTENPNNLDDNLINEIELVLKNFSNEINETVVETVNGDVIHVKIKKLHPDAVIPRYAIDGDVGMDLTCISFEVDDYGNYMYGTGLSMEIPKNYAGFIFPRSSISKYSLSLSNAVGVIDPGYRGEIICKFKPTPEHKIIKYDEDFIGVESKSIDKYEIGDRIAQIIIMPRPNIKFIELDNLSESERSKNGFGSTGK